MEQTNNSLRQEIEEIRKATAELQRLLTLATECEAAIREEKQQTIITSRKNITMIGVMTTMGTLLLIVDLVLHYFHYLEPTIK
jgi:hypothetical protein